MQNSESPRLTALLKALSTFSLATEELDTPGEHALQRWERTEFHAHATKALLEAYKAYQVGEEDDKK